jgi:hypothetical protein
MVPVSLAHCVVTAEGGLASMSGGSPTVMEVTVAPACAAHSSEASSKVICVGSLQAAVLNPSHAKAAQLRSPIDI